MEGGGLTLSVEVSVSHMVRGALICKGMQRNDCKLIKGLTLGSEVK